MKLRKPKTDTIMNDKVISRHTCVVKPGYYNECKGGLPVYQGTNGMRYIVFTRVNRLHGKEDTDLR